MNRPFVLCGIFMTAAVAGCTRPAEDKSAGPAAAQKASDPWPVAAAELRRSTDAATCRRVLNQLSADIAGNPTATAPVAISPAAADKLRADLGLSPEDSAELRGTSYTGLDALYLADAFFLRDAAKSLDLAGLPPEKQAAAAFAWVCRQVYLRPTGGPTPPVLTLRRGFGTGFDRATVFLALCQQLGLDAVLVGPPGRETTPAVTAADPPFVGVAVRAGADFAAFDPYRGIPLTPPADAVAYLAIPVSAVTPRMKLLETQFAAAGLKLAVDPDEWKSRIQTEVIAKQKPKPWGLAIWAPPADPFGYARIQATFLPAEDGGRDRSLVGQRLTDKVAAEAMPGSLTQPPPGLKYTESSVLFIVQVTQAFENGFAAAGPREKIQRGQFNDATKYLIERESVYAAAIERVRTDTRAAENTAEWVAAANDVYQTMSLARLPENRGQLPAAELGVADFWKKKAPQTQAMLEAVAAPVGRAEAGYLLALCKHEQAERAQLRFRRTAAAAVAAPSDAEREAAAKIRDKAATGAADAWAAASDSWGRYLLNTPADASAPGRTPQATALSDRARRLAADPAAD